MSDRHFALIGVFNAYGHVHEHRLAREIAARGGQVWNFSVARPEAGQQPRRIPVQSGEGAPLPPNIVDFLSALEQRAREAENSPEEGQDSEA